MLLYKFIGEQDITVEAESYDQAYMKAQRVDSKISHLTKWFASEPNREKRKSKECLFTFISNGYDTLAVVKASNYNEAFGIAKKETTKIVPSTLFFKSELPEREQEIFISSHIIEDGKMKYLQMSKCGNAWREVGK